MAKNMTLPPVVFCGCSFKWDEISFIISISKPSTAKYRKMIRSSHSINIMTPPPPSLPVAPSISRPKKQWNPEHNKQHNTITPAVNLAHPLNATFPPKTTIQIHAPFSCDSLCPTGSSFPKGGRFERPLNSQIRLAVVNRGVVGPTASRTDASLDWQTT